MVREETDKTAGNIQIICGQNSGLKEKQKWSNALMIIGTLMALETCLILGRVSHNLLYSTKKAPDGYMWSGVRWTKKQLTTLDEIGKICQSEGEAKVDT